MVADSRKSVPRAASTSSASRVLRAGQLRATMPRTYAACPTCCRSSETTLTRRTPSVTGGSHDSSTTASRSGSRQPLDVAHGLFVHRVVVPGQQVTRVDADRVDLFARLPVTRRPRVERKAEALGPPAGGPHLLARPRHRRRDRPGCGSGARSATRSSSRRCYVCRQLLRREVCDDRMHATVHPSEGVDQQFGCVHGSPT